MSAAIFIFNGNKIKIQCSKEDKMKDICLKFVSKINININDIYFIYGGNIINLELKYKEIVNKIDNNEMTILVYEKEKEGLICPYCGGNINIDINNIILFNNNIKNKLNGLKSQLENITKYNNNNINDQINNIIYIMENIIEEIKKNNEKINNDKLKIENMIKGIIDIQINDINKDIILYNSNEEIDVYINNNKINIINNNNKKKIYRFEKEGKYEFKLLFKNKINIIRFI